jgi:hypothetical protein
MLLKFKFALLLPLDKTDEVAEFEFEFVTAATFVDDCDVGRVCVVVVVVAVAVAFEFD